MNHKLLKDEKIIVVTDRNVYKYYKNFLYENFKNIKKIIVLKPGESTKSIESLLYIYKEFYKLKVDKSYKIVAFGGGVITDLTSFASSTYMRGLDLITIPTTLLSMVDASIGGKNAINLFNVKNLIGSFYKSKKTIKNQKFLKTLPQKEILAGLSETIKHALIKDKKLFYFLKNKRESIIKLNSKSMKELITKSSKIKEKIVKVDFYEKGTRRLLNFGHTLAHALESSFKISHGEAVSLGMVFALKLSVKKRFLSEKDFSEIISLFKDYNLPVDFNKYIKNKNSNNKKKKEIFKKILFDKKKEGRYLNFILLKGIGRSFIHKVKIEELYDIY